MMMMMMMKSRKLSFPLLCEAKNEQKYFHPLQNIHIVFDVCLFVCGVVCFGMMCDDCIFVKIFNF